MTPEEIAEKYVHGLHDALTDSQEKKDMANDIKDYAKEYHERQLKSLDKAEDVGQGEEFEFIDCKVCGCISQYTKPKEKCTNCGNIQEY